MNDYIVSDGCLVKLKDKKDKHGIYTRPTATIEEIKALGGYVVRFWQPLTLDELDDLAETIREWRKENPDG